MASQNDYGANGSGDTTLVPGTLIAYRHFALVPGKGLAPMNKATNDIYWRPQASPGEPFEAVCNARWLSHPDGAPQVNCSCGFYAHYGPETDFYAYAFWNADGNPLCTPPTAGGYYAFIGQGLQQGTGAWDEYFDPTGAGGKAWAVVRGVVELSGRIVMGSKGVRAQRLKVKALAVDWEKFHRSPWQRDRDREWDFSASYDSHDGLFSDFAREVSLDLRDRLDDIKAEYEADCRDAAAGVGAEYFTDPKAMYEKFPQPDLSALGIAPAKPKAVSIHESVLTPTAVLKQLAQQVLAAFDVPADVALPPTRRKPKAKGQKATYVIVDEMSPFQRAMEAKRNRPAPPGVGIDRRKGKL